MVFICLQFTYQPAINKKKWKVACGSRICYATVMSQYFVALIMHRETQLRETALFILIASLYIQEASWISTQVVSSLALRTPRYSPSNLNYRNQAD
jgi:hypothetical protein